MKDRLLRFTAIMLVALCLNACETEVESLIYDFSPIEIYVYVQDGQGNDLLDSVAANAIDYRAIEVECKGETYPVEVDTLHGMRPFAPATTREYMPYFYGPQLRQGKNMYYLYVGEYDGGKDVKGERITIRWGDGRSDVITFSNKVKYTKNDVKVKRHFYLNGRENAGECFYLTRP